MGKYRIMLVDDEEEVRSAILKKLDWESLGYSEVCDAENGEDALEKMEHFAPDVLLTDIRMPYMDGLELCERVRKTYPNIKLLIFSGFDEFEYAKQAIRLNVSEYILKPVNLQELSAILKKAAEGLDEEIREKAEQYGIDLLNARKWVVAAAELEKDQGDMELGLLSVQRFLEDSLKSYYRLDVFRSMDDRLCILTAIDDRNTQTDLISLLNEICRECGRILARTVTMGVGHSCTELEHADQAYQSALEALRYKREQLTGTAIYISDMQLENENASAKAVAEAKKYISEHYHDPDLSVDEVCRQLHVSPNYFSTIFKRETGKTYIAYLTGLRMEKAVELLKNTQLKTYAIAERVGYQEQNYFSYVFKKTYGVSPSKYRNRQE